VEESGNLTRTGDWRVAALCFDDVIVSVCVMNSWFCVVLKHKMRNMVWTKGTSALDGEFQSASEVDFYIDKVPV